MKSRHTALLLTGLGIALVAFLVGYVALAHADPAADPVSVLVGGSYEPEVLEQFAGQAIAYDSDYTVTILVLPLPYATDPYTITPQERADNLDAAIGRANQVFDACDALVVSPTVCLTTVVDIQIRSDADDPARVAFLEDPAVDGVFILGGDQTIAMLVTANTLTEDALETLYNAGVPLGGTSAGAAVQSRYMLAGYAGWQYWPWDGLEYGSIDLWYGATDTVTRGLHFGLEDAVVDQHFLERGRILRLLQAAQRKPGSRVGVGVDWGTGLVVNNRQIMSSTAGLYASVVLDEETYGSADAASYVGPLQVLSIHDVAVHILPTGPYAYDLTSRLPLLGGGATLDAPPDISGRDFSLLEGPDGAGTLYLTGSPSDTLTATVISEFAALAQGAVSPTVVLAVGYATGGEAAAVAGVWANTLTGLGVSDVQTATLTAGTDLELLMTQLQAAGALLLTGDDQEAIAGQVADLQTVGLAQRWQEGRPVLLNDAAAPLAGEWLSAGSNWGSSYPEEDSFYDGFVVVEPGLNLLPGTSFEPRVAYDEAYGRMVSVIHTYSDTVAVGIQRDAALKVTPNRAEAIGDNALIVLDGRYVGFQGLGDPVGPYDDRALAATWLLLDTFPAGEELSSSLAHRIYLPLLGNNANFRIVRILVPDPAQAESFETAMQPFEAQSGINLVFEGVDDFENEIVQRAAQGRLPDLALFPQPGLLGDLVADGHTVDLNGWFDPAYLQQQYDQSWLDMATIDGEMAGVWYKANVKSLVWYPVPEFANAGYQIPQTWAEMLALTDQIVADGDAPWCLGIDSGPATGWVGTDWVEDILLRTAPVDDYDRWVRGEILFASTPVSNAFQTMADIWFDEDYVLGGRAAITTTFFGDAPLPMFDDPPSCWLHRQGSFITNFFPPDAEYGVDYDYFYLPPIDAQYGDPVLIAGAIFGVFNDTPDIRQVVEYLTTGESVRWWVEAGNGISPHNDADLDWYPALMRGIAEILMNADTVRFDGSDLMPGAVGTGSFWTGIVDYVNGVDLAAVLANIDATWP